eukprot:TRINITY_DN1104_c0_g2_i1.p2 TRINITY_DN1104_c0_g2~~TRINITY_DN1104_c0_g2_i1.p2  ORF type:complete len:365 (-),score=15.68 TRINITY_DN1104_c0_g2_i1:158-1129(-)
MKTVVSQLKSVRSPQQLRCSGRISQGRSYSQVRSSTASTSSFSDAGAKSAANGSPASAEVKGQTPPSLYVDLPREQLKGALLDSLYSTDRGVKASSEIRAEINELITQLESKNPTPSTSEAKDMLNGVWKLVYTSSPRTLTILAAGNLPLFSVGDLIQTIDINTNTVENKVELQLPFSKSSFSTVASFEVRSPKRLQVKFERGIIQTPEILESVKFPPPPLGQQVDLSSTLSQILTPTFEVMKGILGQVGNLINQAPNLEFPIDSQTVQTWLLTTYLDDSLRISRSEGDGVFILVKDPPQEVLEGQGEQQVLDDELQQYAIDT